MFPVLTAGSRWELWADVTADIAAAFCQFVTHHPPKRKKGGGGAEGESRRQETCEGGRARVSHATLLIKVMILQVLFPDLPSILS